MGHHNIRYVGDPNADSGFWGTPTSVANFCEEDYAVTSYIAEFINTLTNLSYIYYAFRYAKSANPATPWYQKIDFMAFSLVCVGVTSAMFHGTMRQVPQLMDDLSMLLLAGALLQPIYALNQTPFRRVLVALTLIFGIGTVSVIYARSGRIVIHMWTFITLLTFIWPRTLYLVRKTGYSGAQKRVLMRSFARAGWALLAGYALWNVDLELCLGLRALRDKVGIPFSWGLELHGWWHFLTALGASHYIRLVRMLTGEEPIKVTPEDEAAVKAHRQEKEARHKR
ncbi:hypothetical protein D7B24_001405 [Verticillium nonalfalfae]|uniref:Alkaline ceramidase 3 n=1 Tax=Verticillium nonalfalfae TaxID=1051616 RepID=A0A3M9Y1F5_9PEZI|nr:uncharacterized protein D7B24_001405 [Verticillium nonalfalfae]RNJ53716.1 hypothetical protein D7B24_001405 [Verticillium nonalfalfae]